MPVDYFKPRFFGAFEAIGCFCGLVGDFLYHYRLEAIEVSVVFTVEIFCKVFEQLPDLVFAPTVSSLIGRNEIVLSAKTIVAGGRPHDGAQCQQIWRFELFHGAKVLDFF